MTPGSHRAAAGRKPNTCTFGGDPIAGGYHWTCMRCGEILIQQQRHDLHLEVNAHINSETRR